MSIKCNIYEKPFVVTLRRNGEEFDLVLWGENEKAVKERVQADLGETIEFIAIRKR